MNVAIYRPLRPFDIPFLVYPISTVVKKGSPKKVEGKPFLIYASCSSFGVTETKKNDLLVIEDTWNIETWYRPDITSECLISFAHESEQKYEILGTPENINHRNQFLKFKIRKKGGVA